MHHERRDYDERFGEWPGLVVGPCEEEVFRGILHGAGVEGDQGGVGDVGGEKGGEDVGAVFVGAEY